jgi:hypothetical protein
MEFNTLIIIIIVGAIGYNFHEEIEGFMKSAITEAKVFISNFMNEYIPQQVQPQDKNGLRHGDYDKNGWAQLANGKWVANPNGEVVYTEPIGPSIKTLKPEVSSSQIKQSGTQYQIASDGYIHVGNYRYKPNGNYTETAGFAFLKGNSALNKLAGELWGNTDYETLLNIYQ